MEKEVAGIKSLIQKKGKNYYIMKRISSQKLLGMLYSLGNLFTICSSWENFPTTCIESQCCGTPVCGFDKCGTKETVTEENILEKNGNSSFVKYGDIDALAEVTEKILEQQTDREKLSQAAKRRYASQRMSREYLRLYKEML